MADAVTTLFVIGDVDLRTAPELRESGIAELESHSCAKLILDLSSVEFMDSTGLAAMLGIGLAAEKNQKALVLRAPSEPVFYVLDAAGLGEEFTVEEI